jgi:hypothetical protein
MPCFRDSLLFAEKSPQLRLDKQCNSHFAMQLWKPGLSHKEYCTQRQRFQNNPVFLIQKKSVKGALLIWISLFDTARLQRTCQRLCKRIDLSPDAI